LVRQDKDAGRYWLSAHSNNPGPAKFGEKRPPVRVDPRRGQQDVATAGGRVPL